MPNEQATLPPAVSELITIKKRSRVRAWREHLGLTKEEVAVKMGTSVAALEQIEARSAKPRKATLAKVAAALGVTVEQLSEDT